MKNSPFNNSFFTENEFVVFDTQQITIKYLVEYVCGTDDVANAQQLVVSDYETIGLNIPVMQQHAEMYLFACCCVSECAWVR